MHLISPDAIVCSLSTRVLHMASCCAIHGRPYVACVRCTVWHTQPGASWLLMSSEANNVEAVLSVQDVVGSAVLS